MGGSENLLDMDALLHSVGVSSLMPMWAVLVPVLSPFALGPSSFSTLLPV